MFIALCLAILALGSHAGTETESCSPYSGQPLRTIETLDGDKGPIRISMCKGRYHGVISFNARTYCVNGKPLFPGPTIEISSGNALTIVHDNDMPADSPVPPAGHNHLGSADTTNLHVHGLHVAPQEDNVCLTIAPGRSYTYKFNVPSDHYPGTHWYHPHFHGSSTLQVGGTMHGLLIVKDDKIWPKELKNMPEHRLMLSHLKFAGFAKGQSNAPGPDWVAISDHMEAELTLPLNYSLSDPALADVLVVNGQYQPVVKMTVGKPSYFRVVLGVTNSLVELQIHDPRNVGKCRIWRLGFDGVFHDEPLLITAIVLPQGGRADVVIQCDGEAGDYRMASYPAYSRDELLARRYRFSQMIVWSIDLQPGTPNPSSVPVPAKMPAKPGYLQSLLKEPLAGTWRIALRHSPRYVQNGKRQGFHAVVNGKSFSSCDSPFYEMDIAKTYEYTFAAFVEQLRVRHPYHQHINHFQVSAVGDASEYYEIKKQSEIDNIMRVGEWRDTIMDLPNARFRVKPMGYTGTVIMHCHILHHEDEGMMTTYQIRLGSKYPGCHYVENLSQRDCSGTHAHPAATVWRDCQAACCGKPNCHLWQFYNNWKGCQLGLGDRSTTQCLAKPTGNSVIGERISRIPSTEQHIGHKVPVRPFCNASTAHSPCSANPEDWHTKCPDHCRTLPGDCHHVAWHQCGSADVRAYRCSCQCCTGTPSGYKLAGNGNGGCATATSNYPHMKSNDKTAGFAACADKCTKDTSCTAFEYCKDSNCKGNCGIHTTPAYLLTRTNGYPTVSCYKKKHDCTRVTKSGKACVFPFRYNGEEHLDCTTVANAGVEWCATHIDSGGNYVRGKWGNCRPCPGPKEIATEAATPDDTWISDLVNLFLK